ncbi:MAG: thioredoxin-disulfide reductase [Candidatus Babeliales bacterium]
MTNEARNLIIIGSGPAGLTAGVYAARANLKPLIIDGPEPGGQLMGTTTVENWPGEKSILGPELMQKMRDHAKNAGAEFKSGVIKKVDFSSTPFKLWTEKEEELTAHAIIIATGATPKRLNCPGEDKYWGKGVTTCAVCDGAFFKDKPVVIVGGGDTAMEDASFMTRYTDDITIVQIEEELTASEAMKERVINKPNIDIIYNSTVTEIKGDDQGVKSVIIENKKTGEKKEIETNAVFIAVGLKPNTQPFKGQIDLEDNGYLIVKDNTKTSVKGVFAGGDVHDYRYRQAITAAGAGCMAALDAEKYLKEHDL